MARAVAPRLTVVLGAVAALLAPALAEPDGKALFAGQAEPACAVCHVLSDAGAAGVVGPSLDDLKPDPARVRAAVSQGVGLMPSYGDTLTEGEIEAIAVYVAEVAGR